MTESQNAQLFDDWPDQYEKWFTTPIGSLVKRVEWELIYDLLRPGPGEFILDAGCGTSVFTLDMISCGAPGGRSRTVSFHDPEGKKKGPELPSADHFS